MPGLVQEYLEVMVAAAVKSEWQRRVAQMRVAVQAVRMSCMQVLFEGGIW